jgi:hypothetical protein
LPQATAGAVLASNQSNSFFVFLPRPLMRGRQKGQKGQKGQNPFCPFLLFCLFASQFPLLYCRKTSTYNRSTSRHPLRDAPAAILLLAS